MRLPDGGSGQVSAFKRPWWGAWQMLFLSVGLALLLYFLWKSALPNPSDIVVSHADPPGAMKSSVRSYLAPLPLLILHSAFIGATIFAAAHLGALVGRKGKAALFSALISSILVALFLAGGHFIQTEFFEGPTITATTSSAQGGELVTYRWDYVFRYTEVTFQIEGLLMTPVSVNIT